MSQPYAYRLTDTYRDPLCPDSEVRMEEAIAKNRVSLVNDEILFKSIGYLVGVPLRVIDTADGSLLPTMWYSLGHSSFDLRQTMRQQEPDEPQRIQYEGTVELIRNRPIRETYRDRSRLVLEHQIRTVAHEIMQQPSFVLEAVDK